MSQAASNRSFETLKKLSLASSKPVLVYFDSGLFFKEFSGVRVAAEYFKADHKTITKYINSKELFKNNYRLNYKEKD